MDRALIQPITEAEMLVTRWVGHVSTVYWSLVINSQHRFRSTCRIANWHFYRASVAVLKLLPVTTCARVCHWNWINQGWSL